MALPCAGLAGVWWTCGRLQSQFQLPWLDVGCIRTDCGVEQNAGEDEAGAGDGELAVHSGLLVLRLRWDFPQLLLWVNAENRLKRLKKRVCRR